MNNIEKLSKLLKINKLTIGSVESLTGGLFASSMTSIPGASKIFKGALITYFTEEKIKLLGIEEELIDQVGVVSNEVAYYMAKNGKSKLGTDICVSFTGNAGPDTMEGKPCGLVYIGIAYLTKVLTYECHFSGTRDEIRKACCDTAAKLILKHFTIKN